MKTSEYWIEKLELQSHPEGGYFKEIYRSPESINIESIPERFGSSRSFSTSIYFLLEKGQKSAFHRIKSDELWHFYDGEPAIIYVLNDEGTVTELKLGLNIENGYFPQIVVPANCWFAAESAGEFTFVGCTVSPGFDFEDFDMAKRTELINSFPSHRDLITKFT